MPVHLFINGIWVAKLDSVTMRSSNVPWESREIVARLDNKEYILPPDTIFEEDIALQRIKVSCQLDMEKALDYIASGDLPACVGEAFKAEPNYAITSGGQLTIDDIKNVFATNIGSLVNFNPPPPLVVSAKQAIALGLMTQEDYDKQVVTFPRFDEAVAASTVVDPAKGDEGKVSGKVFGVEILNDGTGRSIEDTYGFGILSKERADEIARGLGVSPGFFIPPEMVDLIKESTKELSAGYLQSKEEQEMALAIGLLDVTLDPVEAREV